MLSAYPSYNTLAICFHIQQVLDQLLDDVEICQEHFDIEQYQPMLSKIIEKLPILPNNSLNCPNIAKKFPIMPNDVLYSSKVTKYYFSCLLSELCYCKEHSNFVYYCRINPYTVRYWPILSSGPLFRNIPIKANLQLLQV